MLALPNSMKEPGTMEIKLVDGGVAGVVASSFGS
jgi:hypothetical protein